MSFCFFVADFQAGVAGCLQPRTLYRVQHDSLLSLMQVKRLPLGEQCQQNRVKLEHWGTAQGSLESKFRAAILDIWFTAVASKTPR